MTTNPDLPTGYRRKPRLTHVRLRFRFSRRFCSLISGCARRDFAPVAPVRSSQGNCVAAALTNRERRTACLFCPGTEKANEWFLDGPQLASAQAVRGECPESEQERRMHIVGTRSGRRTRRTIRAVGAADTASMPAGRSGAAEQPEAGKRQPRSALPAPVAPIQPRTPRHDSWAASAALLAQLIAGRLNLPQARRLRRASPGEARTAYEGACGLNLPSRPQTSMRV